MKSKRMEIGTPVIVGGLSQAEKDRMIRERLAAGWKCYTNRITGVRHIWVSPRPIDKRTWLSYEIALVEEAVAEIERGASIYSQVKALKNDTRLCERSWESIRGKINQIRRAHV